MIATMRVLVEREIARADAAAEGEDPDIRRRAEAEGLRARQQRLRYVVLAALPTDMAGVLAVFAQLERRLIGERTRLALAQRREAGVRLGRPREVARIAALNADGYSVRRIAVTLTKEGRRPPRGGEWRVSTLHRIVQRDPADAAQTR